MTEQQFARWKEFSLAMARGYPRVTEARRAKIAAHVERFFANMDEDDWRGWLGWDENEPGVCFCLTDYYSEWTQSLPGYWQLSDAEHERWRLDSQLHCCIRAGVDMAAEPSAGVIGFTAGELRGWFGGAAPEWVNAGYEVNLNEAPASARVWL